jgi:transposase
VGWEDGSPFSVNIVALAVYLRFTHAISYRRLTQLFLHLYALQISEGALDAILQRAKPRFDNEVAAILARLRRSRLVCSDETTVRVDGRTHWNWVFQNDQVVIHVVRNSRAANVVTEMMAGHRPSIWVSDLYGAQQGHADLWQVCLAHQLRDCKYAVEAGDLTTPLINTLRHYTRPKVRENNGCWSSSRVNASISGCSHRSGIVGIRS